MVTNLTTAAAHLKIAGTVRTTKKSKSATFFKKSAEIPEIPAAIVVFMQINAALISLEPVNPRVLPALNPYQPVHKIKVPKTDAVIFKRERSKFWYIQFPVGTLYRSDGMFKQSLKEVIVKIDAYELTCG